MSLKKFRAYQLALEFYRGIERTNVPIHLKDQLRRASSSICLNLAEGSAKPTPKDRHKFYRIALGSQRECISILDLSNHEGEIYKLCDQLGGHLYQLAKSEKV